MDCREQSYALLLASQQLLLGSYVSGVSLVTVTVRSRDFTSMFESSDPQICSSLGSPICSYNLQTFKI